MTISSLLFYPKDYIGFNKTRLLERRLIAEGFLGGQCELRYAFHAGCHFWRFIPKDINLQTSPFSIPRISIHAVGVWALNNRSVILERTNAVLIEGELSGRAESSCEVLCRLLLKITGDEYAVASVAPGNQTVAEIRKQYVSQ